MARTAAATLGVALILLGWWFVSITAAPQSHAEAIALHLQTYNVPARAVSVSQPWPNALPFYAYGATVMPYNASISVELVTGRSVSGFMVCHDVPYDCRITIRDYQLYSEPIPDIRRAVNGWEWLMGQLTKLITL
jgi:hypothetical protein